MNDIAVSVVCNAHNHRSYIKDALDGFIMQKTNFKFEILIHDDASTDGTADVIREYEKKFPELIKPIYQTENQYSKGVPITPVYQYTRAMGKYIAFCEGDDYWNDCLKLQKQFDAMEANPNVDICAHSSKIIDSSSKAVLKNKIFSNTDTVIPVEKVIEGSGDFVSTCTLFFRAEFVKNMPACLKFYHLDYLLQICGSLRGGMLYLKDDMACYRHNAIGSWSVTIARSEKKALKHHLKLYDALNIFNSETSFKYTSNLNKTLRVTKKHILVYLLSDRTISMRKIKSSPYYDAYAEIPSSERFKTFVRRYFPLTIKLKRKLFSN